MNAKRENAKGVSFGGIPKKSQMEPGKNPSFFEPALSLP
jgi:hypothetical protein